MAVKAVSVSPTDQDTAVHGLGHHGLAQFHKGFLDSRGSFIGLFG